jgi:hypothetical protein
MLGFIKAKFDRDRVRVPAQLVELAQLKGDSSVGCWLLVVTPGRYRLVPDLTRSKGSNSIAKILSEVEEVQEPGDVLDGTDSNERAALVARLIRTTASPDEKHNWRVTIPEEARLLAPGGEKQRFVFFAISAGFIEIWFPDTLRQALSSPISEALL